MTSPLIEYARDPLPEGQAIWRMPMPHDQGTFELLGNDSIGTWIDDVNARHAKIVSGLQEEIRQLQEILADAGEEYGWHGALAKNPPLRPSEAERRLREVRRMLDLYRSGFPRDARIDMIIAACDGLQTPGE